MTLVGLGGGTEDGRIQALGLAQTFREWLAGEAAVRSVLLPRRAGQISAHHAFDRKDHRSPTEHGASGKFSLEPLQLGNFTYDLTDIRRQHVVLNVGLELSQPPRRQLRENRAFVRYRL